MIRRWASIFRDSCTLWGMSVEYWTIVNEVRGFYLAWDGGDGTVFIQRHRVVDEPVLNYDLGGRTVPAAVEYLYSGSSFGAWTSASSPMKLGAYHPRILRAETPWRRPQEHPPFDQIYGRQKAASLASARNLFAQLNEVFRYIEPSTTTKDTYGDQLRSLLILACTEVESAWKAVLSANSVTPPKKPTTKDYVKLLAPMRLAEWGIGLVSYPDYPDVKPFATWDATEGKTTTSLPWYDAYNDTKHNREERLHRATLEHVIAAMVAVQVMYVAQFGWPQTLADEPLYRGFRLGAATTWSLEEVYLPPPRKGPDLGDWTAAPLFP